jgi:hypothetical protein
MYRRHERAHFLGLRRCSSQISKLHTIEAATYRQCLLYSAKRNRFQVGQTPGFKKLDNKPQPYDGTHKEQCSKTTETTTQETPSSIIAQDNGVAATLRTFQLHTIHYISALREATDSFTRPVPVPTFHHWSISFY